MTYQQTLDFLFSQLPMYQRIGAAAYKADLTNTILLCKAADNPYNKFPSIHIAGTNGKGSVSHLTASILQTMGLKTGLYTSPHLVDFRERIRINGKMIPENEVISFVTKYMDEVKIIHPSFFEMTFVMAMEYFAKEHVDIAIIETGMGGRLDSTNIITPILSVITNIDFDHIQFLGHTLEKIAYEKAGIIKNKIPAVIGESNPETDKVFITKTNECNSKIIFADKNFSIKPVNQWNIYNDTIIYTSYNKNKEVYIENIESPLCGIYQMKNIVTVLTVVEELKNIGFDISNNIILDGIKNVKKNTGLRGRWDIISRNPLIICDTAHNQAGIRETMKQLNAINKKKLHIVLGMVNDKDIKHILETLPLNAEYYYCKADVPRGLNVDILEQQATAIGLKGKAYKSVTDAVENAKQKAEKEDVIYIGGSTFVVADFYKEIDNLLY